MPLLLVFEIKYQLGLIWRGKPAFKYPLPKKKAPMGGDRAEWGAPLGRKGVTGFDSQSSDYP
jgi:hypothetical protein